MQVALRNTEKTWRSAVAEFEIVTDRIRAQLGSRWREGRDAMNDDQKAQVDAAQNKVIATYDEYAPPKPPSNVVKLHPEPDAVPQNSAPGPTNSPTQATPPVVLHATPFQWRDPATIPERPWLYGHALIRGQISVTIAPAGTGKSLKKIVDALAMTSGRTLLHDRPRGNFRVWLWNGEDPADEMQRRISAAAVHHNLRPEEFAERLFVDSGRQTEIKIAHMDRNGATIAIPVEAALIETIRANRIDVVSIDPFVSSHAVSENDNNAIDLVSKLWAKIADVTGCAIDLVHHPRKTGGMAVEAEDARGASALIATARVAETMNVMTSEEAAKAGVENRFAFVRVDNAKANLAPRENRASWLKIESVPLRNGRGIDLGDRVGVMVRWQWPNAMDGISPSDLVAVQAAVAAGQWRQSAQAKDWVGKPVAEALGLDLADASARAKVRNLVDQWIKSGALVVVNRQDENRKDRPFVEVGQVAQFPPLPE